MALLRDLALWLQWQKAQSNATYRQHRVLLRQSQSERKQIERHAARLQLSTPAAPQSASYQIRSIWLSQSSRLS
jgi:hypothetical protein